VTGASIDVGVGANRVTHRPYRPARARERKAVWALLADLFDAVAEILERS
jgi:hypothetical protein